MPPTLESWRALIAETILREARPIEKYGHQPRLYELTRAMGAGLDYDDDVVYAAVWLHDLGVFEGHRPADPLVLAGWDNVRYAVEQAPALLADAGFPVEKIAAVLECIRHHQPATEPETIEATILRDADILEQLGAVGILRTVAKVGRDTRYATFTQAIATLRVALDQLPAQLRLPLARALGEARIRLLREFLAATEEEAGSHLH